MGMGSRVRRNGQVNSRDMKVCGSSRQRSICPGDADSQAQTHHAICVFALFATQSIGFNATNAFRTSYYNTIRIAALPFDIRLAKRQGEHRL
jgi:hypothetical protein